MIGELIRDQETKQLRALPRSSEGAVSNRGGPASRALLSSTLALALCGCSYTFDGQAPELPLLGAVPNTEALPHLNHAPAGTARLMYGFDGTFWTVFSEPMTGDFGERKGLRMVHLSAPFEEQTFFAAKYFATASTFYVFDTDPPDAASPMTRVSLLSPGETGPDARFVFPGGPYLLIPDNYNSGFLFFLEKPATKTFLLQKRDGSFSRTFPLPDTVDPVDPLGGASYEFNYNGALLFVRDSNGHLVVHDSSDLGDFDLGKRPARSLYDEGSRSLTTCGADGVRQVPLDGGPDRVLDAEPCDETGPLDPRKNGVLYKVAGVLRFVPLDASAQPIVLLGAELRYLTFTADDQIVYSTEPEDKYVNGASDAWLGQWKIMDRGLGLGFSRDQKKLRWLEDAAQPSGVGALRSASVPGGVPSDLARNVRQYQELRDGRVLAAVNHAFRGTHNRVVVIDEQARTQTWVASAASEYLKIPGAQELIVDVVSGPSTFDIVRVPIPAKP